MFTAFFFFPYKPSARVGLWVAPAALRSPSPVQVNRQRGVGVGHPNLSPFRWTAALKQRIRLCWGPALGRIKIFWYSSPASSQGGCHAPSIPTAHQCNARGPSCHIKVPPSFLGKKGASTRDFSARPFVHHKFGSGGREVWLQVGGFSHPWSPRIVALAKQQQARSEDKYRVQNKAGVIWMFMDTAEQALCFSKAFTCLGNKVVMKTSHLASGQRRC